MSRHVACRSPRCPARLGVRKGHEGIRVEAHVRVEPVPGVERPVLLRCGACGRVMLWWGPVERFGR